VNARTAPVTRDWLHRFAAATREATLSALSDTNTCVFTTRIGVEVLHRYGVLARPQPVFVGVYNREGWDLSNAGVPVSQWPDTAHAVGVSEHQHNAGGSGWDGHLVLMVRLPGKPRTLIDLTADQFDRPGNGLHVGGPVFMDIPTGSEWTPHDPLFTPLGQRGTPDPTIIGYRPMPPAHEASRQWRTTTDWMCPEEVVEVFVSRIRSELDG
jgi:hypothetical protein